MRTTRRTLLQGAVAASAMAVITSPRNILAAPSSRPTVILPKIVGDGVHDDSLGLQAAINGEPFESDGLVRVVGRIVRVGPGAFRLTDTLRIGFGQGLVGHGQGALFFMDDHVAKPTVQVDRGGTLAWTYLRFSNAFNEKWARQNSRWV